MNERMETISARNDKNNSVMRDYTATLRAAGLAKLYPSRPKPGDIEARRAEIPADTRSLTARIFGDPLPGRSALDRSAR
jgi:hypothetical protein